MVYFKIWRVNPLCYVPRVQIAQAHKTDTMHTEKARKRESDTGFMSRRWQHIHNAPCCGEGSKLDWALQTSWANWWHWYHQTVLCHWLMEVPLRFPHALPLNQQLWPVLGVLGQHCPPCPLLLTSERAKWGLQMGRADPCAARIILEFRQHYLPCQAAMRSLVQHHLVVLESESSTSPPPKQIHDRQKKAQNTLVQAW